MKEKSYNNPLEFVLKHEAFTLGTLSSFFPKIFYHLVATGKAGVFFFEKGSKNSNVCENTTQFFYD